MYVDAILHEYCAETELLGKRENKRIKVGHKPTPFFFLDLFSLFALPVFLFLYLHHTSFTFLSFFHLPPTHSLSAMALYPTTSSSTSSTAFIHESLEALEQQDHTISPTIDDTKEQPCRITTSTPDSSASSLCSSSSSTSSECSLDMNINNNCLEVSSSKQENGHNNEQPVSAGSRHECSTPPLLPTTAADAAALCWEVLLYSYCSQWLLPPLVKDDVFLGPPINDNESVMTASSSASSVVASKNSALTPSPPCLSPVTAPAEFLWNHEPLFDGIDDLQHHHQQQPTSSSDNENNKNSNVSSSATCPPTVEDDNISMPSPSSICETDDSFIDDDNDNVPRLSLKRHHSENEASCNNSPPRKRARSKTPSHSTTLNKRRTKRYTGTRRSRNKPIKVVAPYHEPQAGDEHLTVFERLTQAGIDWCRYCGTTEGVNWRPGPWGKRTLCK